MVPDFEARSRPKGTTRWRKRSGASEVARALALLTQRGPVRARGGVFIRSRPPSCAGDRTFRMGTKMGGIRRCFRILLDYLVNLAWMGGISLQRRVVGTPVRTSKAGV